MKVPNQITMWRLLAAIAGLVILSLHPGGKPGEWPWTWVAFGLLMLSATTDYLDGAVARATGQVSKLGRMLDPLVDKVLVCGSLIILAAIDSLRMMIPAWIVAVIVIREILVTTLRGMVEQSGHSFAADSLGKWKMLVQSVAVMGLIAFLGGWAWTEQITVVAIWLSLAMTVISGTNYIRKAWHVLEF